MLEYYYRFPETALTPELGSHAVLASSRPLTALASTTIKNVYTREEMSTLHRDSFALSGKVTFV